MKEKQLLNLTNELQAQIDYLKAKDKISKKAFNELTRIINNNHEKMVKILNNKED